MIENHHNLERALERISKGETAESVLEAGYSSLYMEWAAQNREAKKLMSIEEQARSFERYVTHRFVDEGSHRLSTLPKREQLLHGHMFWVGRDSRQPFAWKSLEELENESALENLLFISPTMKSRENDVHRMAREQSIALIAYNLESTGYAIDASEVSGAFVNFEVHHPNGHYNVQVDLNQDARSPWSYEFSNIDNPSEGKHSVKEGDIESQFDPKTVAQSAPKDPMLEWITSKQNNAAVNPNVNALAAAYAVNQAMQMRDARLISNWERKVAGDTDASTELQIQKPERPAEKKINENAEPVAKKQKQRIQVQQTIEQQERERRLKARRTQSRRVAMGAMAATASAVASAGVGIFGITYFVNFM